MPATIGSGTTNFFNQSYELLVRPGRRFDPRECDRRRRPESVTPANASVGDISEADYTVNGPSDSSSPGTITLVNVIGASNQSQPRPPQPAPRSLRTTTLWATE